MHKPNDGFFPMVIAGLSAMISHLARVDWIGVFGLLVSAGWLAVSGVKLLWEWQDRRARKR